MMWGGYSAPHYNGHPEGKCLHDGCERSAVAGASNCYRHGGRP